MKVTERLASLFIEENLMGRERQSQTFRMGLDARIEGMKREIVQYETELERRRSQSGGKPLSQADLIPYDVMKDVYKTLLVERVEWKFLRRGQQFKVVDRRASRSGRSGRRVRRSTSPARSPASPSAWSS